MIYSDRALLLSSLLFISPFRPGVKILLNAPEKRMKSGLAGVGNNLLLKK